MSFKEGDFYTNLIALIFPRNNSGDSRRYRDRKNREINKTVNVYLNSIINNVLTMGLFGHPIPEKGSNKPATIYNRNADNIDVGDWITPREEQRQIICNTIGSNGLLITITFKRPIILYLNRANNVIYQNVSVTDHHDYIQFCFENKSLNNMSHKLLKIKYANPYLGVSGCWNAYTNIPFQEHLIKKLYMKLLDAQGIKLESQPKKKSWLGLFEQDEGEEDYLKF
tara:strand:- start:3093 stop:3767 length:675 start_codon:yes stop_codon:yes gene_type:complete